jgi:tripartite-type tricarboxylate transporter receptor subunit TctC
MALAQSWPDKPIRIIVPFTAGTGMDILARALAGPLGQRLGQPIVVENKPGASGIIGFDSVAKAPPDGYTLMITANSFVIVPALHPDLPYDTAGDFTAICEVAVGNLALVTHPSLGVSSMAQFVALVKRQPGKLNYASPGNGTPHHLAMELLKQSTGLDIVHIPYKGSAGAVTDVVGGQVPMMILPVHVAMPFVAAGRLNVLAVSGDKRSAQAPAVPTFREAGIENFDVDLWYGLFAPARTPRDVVSRLQQEVAAVMAQPDIRETLIKQGMTPAVGTPEQLAAMIKPDLARWQKVVTEAKIRAD